MDRILEKKLVDFLNLKKIEFYKKLSLKQYNTYKTGGEADIAVSPNSPEKLKAVFSFCSTNKIPFYVLGGGANVIVSDKGVKGVVCITTGLNKVWIKHGKVFAQSGVSLEKLSLFAAENGLSGFEFAYNIPGTVGGALIMNAGNNYGEFSEITCCVRAINGNGKEFVFPNKLCQFGYRHSVFKKRGFVILDACFVARKTQNKDSIFSLMEKIKKERESKFPLEYPNAGSVFKRPEGYYAGKLIEDAGCGGLKVGGAMVSEKHKGFIVNLGDATSEDIKNLIALVQKKVYDKFGVKLEREQIFFPEDFS